MPEIQTTRKDIQALRGVHLFHFPMSNCSQRVRLALSEKDVDWQSHIVDLSANEHITPEFQELNPKAVVPVLVYNGRTITESNDIIRFIDDNFSGPPLQPKNLQDLEFISTTNSLAAKVQMALKLLSHEFLFKPGALKSADELRQFATQCADASLVAFHTEFSRGRGFSNARIREAVIEFEDAFTRLEMRLTSYQWVSGERFGLSDIAWLVNAHRLALMGFSFEDYPKLGHWLEKCKARSSFAQAITSFESKAAIVFFKVYTRLRRLRGTSISEFREPAQKT